MKNTIILTAICFAFFNKSFSQINFTEVLPSPFTTITGGAVAFADIDGDNDQDVLLSGSNNGNRTTKLYVNDGSGIYTEVAGTPFVPLITSAIAFADIDGDGDQDVLVNGLASGGVPSAKLYTNDGTGIFTEVTNVPFPNFYKGGMAFADVDGDGDADLMISGNETPILKLYLNDGLGIFSLSTTVTFTGIYYGSMKFADVDGDEDLDFVVTGLYNNVLQARLYTNDGAGIFTLVAGTPFVGVYRSSIDFADIDGDNDQDLLITGNSSGGGTYASRLYLNDGTGVFTEAATQPFPNVEDSAVAFADVDNDGDPDVMITGDRAGGADDANLYENDGNGNFNLVAGTPFVGVTNSAIAFADIDGDSYLDVLITGNAGSPSSAKLYRNGFTLGIDDLHNENQISFYPNPANTTINFPGISEESNVQVFDLTGKKLMDSKMNINSNSMDVSQLSQGIYLVKINNRFAGKLVKK